ncbi:unnamed protein product [Rotaria sp. Silwood2]|nr:unnamed protein product [Rotaria sp. Silwood2]
MNRSIVNIMNLPGEINLIIWNKLNKIDALYSFLNVNRRFDKLIRDKIYTCSIELIKTNFEEEDNCSLSDQILDRFCLDILPQIHYIVEQLILESFSMERILYAGDYPRLFDTNTLLPRLIDLTIPYSYIEEVTENFTREATHRNCANIRQFHLYFSKENV